MVSFSHTRIAPTPSGYLHIGNALNFLLTDALAKQTGASLLLRIDDMDRERLRPEYLEDVFDTLQWLEIDWQLGPRAAADFEAKWSQRQRMELYNIALQSLRKNSLVFACDCSRTQLAVAGCLCRDRNLSLDAPDVSWRLKAGSHQTVTVKTLAGEVLSVALPAEAQEMVVRRKDGWPAYQLTSLVDDVHFGIDLIVRGQDLWPSTLTQLYLAGLLQLDAFTNVTFFHHPLLLNETGSKLSKSAGDSSLKHWRQSGQTKEDLFAAISSLLHLSSSVKNNNELLQVMVGKPA